MSVIAILMHPSSANARATAEPIPVMFPQYTPHRKRLGMNVPVPAAPVTTATPLKIVSLIPYVVRREFDGRRSEIEVKVARRSLGTFPMM